MGNYTIFGGLENPRRGWQARNLYNKCPENSKSQIVFRTQRQFLENICPPDLSGGHTVASALGDFNLKTDS